MVATGIVIFRYQKFLDRCIQDYPPNVLANYYGNPLNLHALLKSTYSAQSQVRVSAWERFQRTHASSEDHFTSSHRGTMKSSTTWRQPQWKRVSRQKNRIPGETNRTQSNQIELNRTIGFNGFGNRTKSNQKLCDCSIVFAFRTQSNLIEQYKPNPIEFNRMIGFD